MPATVEKKNLRGGGVIRGAWEFDHRSGKLPTGNGKVGKELSESKTVG